MTKSWSARILAIGLTVCAASWPGRGDAASESVHPFTQLPQHFLNSFSGEKLAFQLSAIGATAALILSGSDGNIYTAYSSGHTDGIAAPAYWLGYALAPAVSGAMFLLSEKDNSDDLHVAAMAGLQAAILAVGYSTTLKLFTGRPIPGEFPDLDVYAQSRYFRPGLGRGGVYNGWPSGHAMGAAAFTTAIASYYESPELWIGAVVVTAYISWGMTAGSRGTEHWFSDTVAGSLMGYSIGSTIGEGFRKFGPRGSPRPSENLQARDAPPRLKGPETQIVPLAVEGGIGLGSVTRF